MGIRRKPRVITRQTGREGEELKRALQSQGRERQTVPVYTESTSGGSQLLNRAGVDDVFTGGRLVEGITMSALSNKTIRHGLRAEPVRWAFLSVFCSAVQSVSLAVSFKDDTSVIIRNNTNAEVNFDLYIKA